MGHRFDPYKPHHPVFPNRGNRPGSSGIRLKNRGRLAFWTLGNEIALIVNALEAMGAANEGPRELLISATKEASGVLVAVQDSGPGLEAAMLERVFESFYTTKPTGLGLGLSICRSIIEAHGGRLWASTNQRRGATFQFTLPPSLH